MTGAERIALERKRQIEVEDWTEAHDDGHIYCELAWAAVCYAAPETVFRKKDSVGEISFTDPWPDDWDIEWDKRKYDGNVVLPNSKLSKNQRIRQLEKAGALIAAEIDRLLRT